MARKEDYKKYYISFVTLFSFLYIWWLIIVGIVMLILPTIENFIGVSMAGVIFFGIITFYYIVTNPIKVNKNGLMIKNKFSRITTKWELIKWSEITGIELVSVLFLRYIKIFYNNGKWSFLIPLSVHRKHEYIDTLQTLITDEENPLKVFLTSGRIVNRTIEEEHEEKHEEEEELFAEKTEEELSAEETKEEFFTEETIEEKGPIGIGGWLIPVAFGRIVTPIALIVTIFLNFSVLFTIQRYPTFYSELWRGMTIFEIVLNIILLAVSIVVLVLLLGKKRMFKKVFIFNMVLAFFLSILEGVFQANLQSVIPELTGNPFGPMYRNLSSACIWIPYMHNSVRVKNTFVR